MERAAVLQSDKVERAAVKMFALSSREKCAAHTSVFSWAEKASSRKFCLFWAQAQNTRVSDELGRQTDKQLGVCHSFMFVDYVPYGPAVHAGKHQTT